jgi:hypothetical protein
MYHMYLPSLWPRLLHRVRHDLSVSNCALSSAQLSIAALHILHLYLFHISSSFIEITRTHAQPGNIVLYLVVYAADFSAVRGDALLSEARCQTERERDTADNPQHTNQCSE